MSSKYGQYNMILFDSCEKNRSAPLKYMFRTAVLLAIIVAGVCLLITRIVDSLFMNTADFGSIIKLSRHLERLLDRYELLTKYIFIVRHKTIKVFNRT